MELAARMNDARSLLARARKRAVGMGLETMFETLSRAGKVHPYARTLRRSAEVIRDIPYAGESGHPHTLDIYRPRDAVSGPRPVMFYIHGGGFVILSKDTHWMFGYEYARRGFITVNVNYRLAPRHPYPLPLQDVAQALAWVVDNIEQYGGDPGHICFAGESAGGNLATALASR